MIIFDLDGTLADCEHRRHFVDPKKSDFYESGEIGSGMYFHEDGRYWKPNWKSFYQACDKDIPNTHVIEVFLSLYSCDHDIEIWSGRCESVRQKTLDWLGKHIPIWNDEFVLKMRPIADYTPDEQLKERWLDERIADMGNQLVSDIEFVFDDRPKVVRMWRRRGIFVFDVNQSVKEF